MSVKGTAPAATPDLDEVIRLVRLRLPEVAWQQVPVSHAADDDGLWFFWGPTWRGEVQIESSTGTCPFVVETDKHDGRRTTNTPAETADTVVAWLRLPGGRANPDPTAT